MRCSALLLQSITWHFFSKALLCHSVPMRCFALLLQGIALLFISGASRSASSALRVQALPQLCGLLHILRAALPCGSYPRHFIALHCPTLPLPSKTVPMPCTAFLLPGRAWPSDAFSCLCLSVPGFSGAYPLGPLPAPISVLGEELPDPALGIEWEPLCPGRGLAHDAPYILEVCLRSVGVPLDDHLVVDVEDHPVSGLLEVV